MTPTIAILSTLDTKGIEAAFVVSQIEACGGAAILMDIGIINPPTVAPDISREEIATAAGSSMASLLENPTRQEASKVMIEGAANVLRDRIAKGSLHGVISMGGTQGTPNCTAVMRQLPYGFPKVMVSTIASGDVAPFVDIKDITMMFSVCDILGLNPLTRKILSNAAAAVVGMAEAPTQLSVDEERKPTIGITNLGVLTDGTMHAVTRLADAGFEVMVFHAVGSGGRAMEQLMKEGVIDGVFDYAMGEISDELFGGLRAASKERLTVASSLGIPQVICPGGAEHIGLLVEPDTVPPEWSDHQYVFHNPVIFAPRLSAAQLQRVGEEMGRRLQECKGDTVMMLPTRGVSRYAIEGGPLHDPASERVFLEAIAASMPSAVDVVEVDAAAEDHAFVDACVDRLIAMVDGGRQDG